MLYLWTNDLPCTHSVSLALWIDCTLLFAATAIVCYLNCIYVILYIYISEVSLHAQLYTLHLLLPSPCTPSHQPATLWAIAVCITCHSLTASFPELNLYSFYFPGCSGPSGFSKWLSENKKTLHEAHVGASHEEIVKLGIKQWRAMPKEEKQHWQ